ncbi:selenium metabolism protein YedF [Sporobacter termitidis DSM 10068]|uniref:Selenium metabolism protein YedF n=1 Tax=Sporobacter termitidis DSM 10068 TaxID=1123282 RepID=A0A1M5UAY8_9FIRM|nr:sulfurtransferase-like selenium metabolism protein YedF [Sporobacter termitidis]SHH60016.1 selenium metabolism protein YedF [Sporobacter termitidis DSM 10068]
MEIIDMLGKPCPIPVIEAKKALARPGADSILVKVDNFVAVQNLEKMAKGYGYGFTYAEKSPDAFDVSVSLDGKAPPVQATAADVPQDIQCAPGEGLVVAIGRNTMGEGAEELGKILIKGFVYSLTELPAPPAYVFFFNSGAYLTTEGANTIDDLKKLEEKGTKIFTCGTCLNYYNLQEKLAVGAVTNMFGITEKLAAAANVINI